MLNHSTLLNSITEIDDYAAMYKSGYEDMIISKPHNIYLQCAMQSGMLSLVCLLGFYLIYFIKNCKRVVGKQETDRRTSLMQNV